MDDIYTAAVVIDFGSHMIKAGIGGEDAPCVLLPPVVGHPRHSSQELIEGKPQAGHIGWEALHRRGSLKLSFPYQRGRVTNWEDLKELLSHLFYKELRVAPEEHPMLVCVSPCFLGEERLKLAQVFFETFRVPALLVAEQAQMAMNEAGRTSGLVVSCGHSISSVVPIYEGCVVAHAVRWSTCAGDTVTQTLMDLFVQERGYHFTTAPERDIVHMLKERLGYVARNVHDEEEVIRSWEQVDGSVLPVGSESFRSCEILFAPNTWGKMRLLWIGRSDPSSLLYGMSKDILRLIQARFKAVSAPALQYLVKDAVAACDQEMWRDLWSNIVLEGGTTLLRGFSDRLALELGQEGRCRVKVVASVQKYRAWLGGSIFAGLRAFQDSWVTWEEYQEHGAKIINWKCL